MLKNAFCHIPNASKFVANTPLNFILSTLSSVFGNLVKDSFSYLVISNLFPNEMKALIMKIEPLKNTFMHK